jgi:hypothetical protein
MDEEKVFCRPSFPKDRPPTIKELFYEQRQTAVNLDYTKNMPREIRETMPEKRHNTNFMLIKTSMDALLRETDKNRLKNKIQKADRDWVTEKEDNYREHNFDKKTQGWKFNFNDSALDRKGKQGPFTMSRLAAMVMCESGIP